MDITKTLMLSTIIIYLLAMIYIGYYYSKKNKTSSDFYLGGRKLGPLVTAMSAEASDMSSWLLMGLPGLAYLTGLADATWTAIGLAIGTYINWLIIAKRIRVYSQVANNSITLPDFFSNRFKDQSKTLMMIAAIFIIIFFIPYTASGFAACGKLFSALFGISYLNAMVISAIIIVAYCALGGFLAASTTDFVQSIVMSIALVIVVMFGIESVGGIDYVIENAKGIIGYLSISQSHNVATNTASNYTIITIISTLAWGLGYFGMPHILLRFMAIEDKDKLKTSRRIATVWVVISMCAAVGIGIIGLAMTNYGVLPQLAGSASETIIINIANLLSTTGIIPAILAGIIMAGIFAATMSTADSQLLAASSSITQNIIIGKLNINLSEKKQIRLDRLSVILISIVAMFIASDANSSVFEIVSFAWAGFGAVFGPVVLFSLFWKRMNKQGAIAGMLSGGITIFVWKFLIKPLGGIFGIYELLPAFIIACVMIIVVSLLTEKPSKDITDEFEHVQQILKQ